MMKNYCMEKKVEKIKRNLIRVYILGTLLELFYLI